MLIASAGLTRSLLRVFFIDDSELVTHGRNCHHTFHKECISQWLMKHDSCPCCRQGILSYEEDSPQDVFRDAFEYLKLLWVYHGGM